MADPSFVGLFATHVGPDLRNRQRRRPAVHHRVTFRTDWEKIAHGIDRILPNLKGELLQMVDLDKSLPELSIAVLKRKAADRAITSVVVNAGLPCFTTSLNSIYENRRPNTLDKFLDLPRPDRAVSIA